MIETTVKIRGMVCGMCESHINDVLRRSFPVKKVSASRTREQAVLLSQEPLDPEALRRCILQTGYEPGEVSARPVEKKGLLARRSK